MGQQQILFVILAVCIIGVVVSVGVLSLPQGARLDNRALVEQDLRTIAGKAQDYVARYGEGKMPFSVLSRMPDAIGRLGFSRSNAHGDFFIRKSNNSSCLQIIGVGVEAGYDNRHPLRMVMTVWADRTSLAVLN